MSDYLFQLESHLTPAQRDVVTRVEAVGRELEQPIFLVGGALRDMLGGFPISDLDFSVQGDAAQVVKTLTSGRQAALLETDQKRQSWELRFANGVTAEIAMARTEQYPNPGKPPVVKPASIHEDLLRRDFTMDSIGISLYTASRGLLLDPANGAGDIERREIRAIDNYGFYDDPVRLLRLIRLKIRLSYEVHPRTQQQYENAREAGSEQDIPPRALFRELRAIAGEANLVDIITALDEAALLGVFSPALSGEKLNLGALGKLQKARELVPFGAGFDANQAGLVLYLLTEKMTPRERSAMKKKLSMRAREADLWEKLPARAAKLESTVKSKKLRRASEIYAVLTDSPADEVLFLLLFSKERLVRDRIRNFLQKHLFTALEVSDREVTALTGLQPTDPRFSELREGLLTARLDGKNWDPPVRPEPEPEPAPAKAKKRGAKKARKQAPAKEPSAPSKAKEIRKARKRKSAASR